MATICFRLFFRLTLTISSLMLVLVGPLRSQPLPPLGTGFDLCNVPCWAGIEPGRTRFEAAPNILARQYPDSIIHSFDQYIEVQTRAASITGTLEALNGDVGYIRVVAAQPLWATVLLLGTPRCMVLLDPQFTPGLMNIYWTLNDIQVMVTINTSRPNPVIQTTTLQLWTGPSTAICGPEEYLLAWPGFLRLRRG